jgi:hypothetical protein
LAQKSRIITEKPRILMDGWWRRPICALVSITCLRKSGSSMRKPMIAVRGGRVCVCQRCLCRGHSGRGEAGGWAPLPAGPHAISTIPPPTCTGSTDRGGDAIISRICFTPGPYVHRDRSSVALPLALTTCADKPYRLSCLAAL